MADAGIRHETLEGDTWLPLTTRILQRLVAEDTMAPLWEPGDMSWMYATVADPNRLRATAWRVGDADPQLVTVEQQYRLTPGKTPNVEVMLIGDVRAGSPSREQIWPHVVPTLADSGLYPDAAMLVQVDARDQRMRTDLEGIGYRANPDDDYVQFARHPTAVPDALPLPDGWRFADMTEPSDGEHHLAKRSGPDVHARLQASPCYDPSLDLRVVTDDGAVAAYCLMWHDAPSRSGEFEPVRTEDAYQGRGIGKALLIEGFRRLMARNVTTIKVISERTNTASMALYQRVGFAEAYGLHTMTREPINKA